MHHIKSKGYRSYIYVVALTVLFMFIVGCEEKTMDKYRMDKADENTYELSGIQDVSLMNNSVYAASGNSIYRTTFDDVTDMSGKLCEAGFGDNRTVLFGGSIMVLMCGWNCRGTGL